MFMDFNPKLPDWAEILDLAEENAETSFEIDFCDSLREKLEKYGEGATLTEAQEYKLNCIARAGGFWERDL